MDSVTQALFGAAVAAAGFRRSLGRRVVLAGAVLGTVPDLDVAVGWVADGFATWRHHRGLTHSIFFGPVVGPLIGLGLARWEARRRSTPAAPPDPERLRAWIWLSVLVLVTHPLIDLFTSYGTQLLAPFSDHRFAINAMPIIDPVYSLALLAAVLVAGLSRRAGRGAVAAACALFFVAAYTLFAWSLDDRTRDAARAQLAERGIVATDVRSYPLLFQPWYRRVVADTPDSIRIGHHSMWAPGPIAWTEVPRQRDPRIDAVAATREGRLLDWFAMGHVAWRVLPDTGGGSVVEGADTRYGTRGESLLGFWGISVPVDAAGRPGEARIFTRRPAADARSLGELWRGITTGREGPELL
ncbi:hypothetical protein CR162_09895 [Pseudoroseomonas rhizosphaerae]|uniref:Hydrolase n=1 Tax=Teichococcus rhizosphaerae TaxID=1335062 RepID=A0A2C7ABM5_9PROT|nr:metal-dependent hydrolase [Pseudoroseomonas rhizosphaerae]PHK95053.1 hypothetical protein CR162_09895 [Pseudoroseomonas rhizosphaerae]